MANNLASHSTSDKRASRFWRMPVRLVTDGTWADFWTGCHGLTSILAPLAVRGWPEGRAPWTPWMRRSYRQLEAESGTHRNTVMAAFRELERRGLLQTRRVAHHETPGRPAQEYRLAALLYSAPRERFVRVSAAEVDSGAWAAVGGNAARHLLLAARALDPVADPEGFARHAATKGLCGATLIALTRRGAAPSVAALSRASGITEKHVARLAPELGLLNVYEDAEAALFGG